VRLLFDQNLSYRLPRRLADLYPGSLHLRDAGLLGTDDGTIWRYAAQHGLTIVSKDRDFL
jgi:predicted nuclease of predicted toxin-antitoxin system